MYAYGNKVISDQSPHMILTWAYPKCSLVMTVQLEPFLNKVSLFRTKIFGVVKIFNYNVCELHKRKAINDIL